jgi:hypothetical protein
VIEAIATKVLAPCRAHQVWIGHKEEDLSLRGVPNTSIVDPSEETDLAVSWFKNLKECFHHSIVSHA